MSKYDPPRLPQTKAETEDWIKTRAEWFNLARENDKLGTAKETGLMILLLQHYKAARWPE